MATLRKPFQGVWNIVRFNWHFYLLAGVLILLLSIAKHILCVPYAIYTDSLRLLVVVPVFISLFVSFYVYDLSGFYTLNWLDSVNIQCTGKIVNLHAGFDETSALLQAKYPAAELVVLDFYNPEKHTEISIERARKAYPAFQNTITVASSSLPLVNNSVNTVFLILAAHEIRNDEERIGFFKELNRALHPGGKIVVTEHLRDGYNFTAYNIGFFHFLSKSCWYKTFERANLKLSVEWKINPFITTFVLEKNGFTS